MVRLLLPASLVIPAVAQRIPVAALLQATPAVLAVVLLAQKAQATVVVAKVVRRNRQIILLKVLRLVAVLARSLDRRQARSPVSPAVPAVVHLAPLLQATQAVLIARRLVAVVQVAPIQVVPAVRRVVRRLAPPLRAIRAVKRSHLIPAVAQRSLVLPAVPAAAIVARRNLPVVHHPIHHPLRGRPAAAVVRPVVNRVAVA